MGVLERVELTRVRHGYGLDAVAPDHFVRIAVEDCQHLGRMGWLIVDGLKGPVACVVVDCQQAQHEPLSALGILADVNRQSLGHRQAYLLLWNEHETETKEERPH